MQRKRVRASGIAAALVAWSFVSPRLRPTVHPFANAAIGTALAAWARAPLGLAPPALWLGLRSGTVAAATVATAVAAGAALPAVRDTMAERRLPDGAAARWLLLRIPLGTAWAEEASYRGALTHLCVDAFGPSTGRLVQSATFGLSHIADARAAGEPVLRTVAVTAAAGWVFAALAARSGSLAAPLLAHLAVNEAGAVAALLVQRVPDREH
ncbi:CPBP family intramembrane metalloprotease [Mycolicibacterium sp. S2-37]|uniref:Rv0804 family intramembrane glutamic endopeptidase n=1 Tax=Mycolicibacterium sp. S2-37 TaxID=2810297 RepID=UPI001A94DBD3|nr:CPBP family intramembrane glutamic endopeptidase [Mycolicibacterium sp. S2-37]MBO0680148.1 CPBP family intramembrane metalloprotease [Mycolicibacterium sp. S2-37]